MKKVLSLLLAALILSAAIFMLTVPALADTGSGAAESSEFFTWATLATYAGALAATLAITELLKAAHIAEKIPTRIVAWIVALLVLLAANYFAGTFTPQSAVLCIINAVVVSLAANGSYDLITSTTKKNE